MLLDSSYVLYAVGLLSQNYPDVALKLFKDQLAAVSPDSPVLA
jgi:hypothetical protein